MTTSEMAMILAKLPRELRDRIYIETLVSDEEINIENLEYDFPWARSEEFPKPGLLGVCPQVRQEALEVYYGQNTFRAIVFDEDSTPPLRWLQSLEADELAALRVLKIEYQISPAVRTRYESHQEHVQHGDALSAFRTTLFHRLNGNRRCMHLADQVACFKHFNLAKIVEFDSGDEDPEPELENMKQHWKLDMQRRLEAGQSSLK